MDKFRFIAQNRGELDGFKEGVIIIPVGATEQHGPHLSVGVDSLLAETVALHVAKDLSPRLPVLVAPTLPYGYSHHHLSFGGAISLRSETLIAVLKDIGMSLAASGFKRLFFLNSHGGNEEAVRLVVRDLAREGVSAAAASYWTVAWDALTEAGALDWGRVPGHAGSFETSLMLHLAAELVHGRPPLREDAPSIADPARRLFVQLPGQGVGKDGYTDDARFASAGKGELYFQIIVSQVAKAVVEFYRQI
ncbi:MAG: creatininase family protein [Firmicutes bacterium]|nr:creatininase family protein [Bacillota bacterium]